jgi:hypothetical protein
MESKEFIKKLKDRSRVPSIIALRQALCYYLWKNNIPCMLIGQMIGYTRRNVYISVYHVQDCLEVSDKTMQNAYEEVMKHEIQIKPYTIDGKIMSRHAGYKMIIDNIIY